MPIDVDIWVRGTTHATTHAIANVSSDPSTWDDADIGTLLTEMLLALDRARHPGGQTPTVTLRGFNWIVSSFDSGVVLHLEMQMGSASAGPFAMDESRLTAMIERVMETEPRATVH
ncbi:MAG: hypothetical protein ABR606_09320 [Vicinamibacterales bacterium]